MCRKHAQSDDCVDDQSLGRSYVKFPQSHAWSCAWSCVWSRACLRACRSCDESCARSHGGDFPGSCGRRFSLVAGHGPGFIAGSGGHRIATWL